MATPINKLIGFFYEAFGGKPDLLDAVITDDSDDIPLGPACPSSSARCRIA